MLHEAHKELTLIFFILMFVNKNAEIKKMTHSCFSLFN